MQADNVIRDYDVVLDARFGKEGTPERKANEEKARDFYSSQILLQARKEAGITQSELASRLNTSKSYISKIENGMLVPSVSTFYRIISALGFTLELHAI